jgi:hypothetical protein
MGFGIKVMNQKFLNDPRQDKNHDHGQQNGQNKGLNLTGCKSDQESAHHQNGSMGQIDQIHDAKGERHANSHQKEDHSEL